ncbi:MAG: NAD(P)-binding domain-containing protein [Planctomycetes bacterium]|nr:NAD(P)-binding domain-containing protein [Planctomycetota bacterium]
MTWLVLVGLVVVCALALVGAWLHRADLARMRETLLERERAQAAGDEAARLQHPVIDLSRCLGCATCVAVCPEQGVLEIAHGQALVVNGARCQGIAACERECPAGAITVSIANLATRRDIPVVDEELAAVGAPGLHLAGEVTAHALVRTAVEHGTRVARAVAERRRALGPLPAGQVELAILGAGPAGLACALEATRLRVPHVVLEQETELGGTVAKYPRRKLVLTEPIELPLVGRLAARSYEKEDLIAIWERAAREHALPIETGAAVEGLLVHDDGSRSVRTSRGTWRARHVCLAVGRRGTPRRLGVPGEDLPKVAYALIDAASFTGRRVLVVGGGDAAVETALALAAQPGHTVSLSYRQTAFVRVRSRNAARLREAVEAGAVRLLLGSEVRAIAREHVVLRLGEGRELELENDEIFVMIGGVPSQPLLEQAGVSFDPARRPQPRADRRGAPAADRRATAVPALAFALVTGVLALGFAIANLDYYGLPLEARPMHDKHALLRPGLGLGLAFGIAAAALVIANLAYLLRRAQRRPFRFGTLRTWMTVHVATGLLAGLCAVLHAALAPRDTPGGQAFWAMLVIVATGGIGRWLYAWVPRAANGRELALADVRARLAKLDGPADGFAARARAEVLRLAEARQWRGSFAGRLLAFAGVQFDLRRALRRLRAEARAAAVPPAELGVALALAREAHREAIAIGHLEDLRAVLSTWRWLHRWLALLMVVLIVVHIGYALAYGSLLGERGGS